MNKEIQKLKIALTTDCVLRCRHCRIDKEMGLDVSYEDCVRAVDTLLTAPGKFKRLELYGGEPFLRFDLMKDVTAYAVRKAAEQKKLLSLSVASNGIIINEEMLSFMRENRINLSLSVSGSKENHDCCRVFADGGGSYDRLLGKIGLILRRMDPYDVVALECAAPQGASGLYDDLLTLTKQGFVVTNVECVHGMHWGKAELSALEKSLEAFVRYLNGEIKKGVFIVPEPFIEFFRVTASGAAINCPLYRDFELYPDGKYGFYPFCFVYYDECKEKIWTGSAKDGLYPKYLKCIPGSEECKHCISDYYTIPGLFSGSVAYTLRTNILKKAFLEIMEKSRADADFRMYVKRLAILKSRQYADYSLK